MPEIWDPQIPTGSIVSGTDYVLVGNSVNRARKVLAGAANGIATLDSTGKLAQPGRIVETQYAFGDSADNPISTTAVIGNYIMPSPRIAVTMHDGYIAMVFANLSIYSYVDSSITIDARIARSVDNGATWAPIGTHLFAGTGGTLGYRQPFALVARHQSGGTETVTFGITVGNPAGYSNTINVHAAQYTSLYVIVIDEG